MCESVSVCVNVCECVSVNDRICIKGTTLISSLHVPGHSTLSHGHTLSHTCIQERMSPW